MKFKKWPWGKEPMKGHDADAGYDLYSPIDVVVHPHDMSERIGLGVGFEIPAGYCGLVIERSSQGRDGVSSIGQLVDHGYTGEVHITLVNNSNEKYEVMQGDRIGQIIFVPVLNDRLELVNEFEETERGDNAHGSTGK